MHLTSHKGAGGTEGVREREREREELTIISCTHLHPTHKQLNTWLQLPTDQNEHPAVTQNNVITMETAFVMTTIVSHPTIIRPFHDRQSNEVCMNYIKRSHASDEGHMPVTKVTKVTCQ